MADTKCELLICNPFCTQYILSISTTGGCDKKRLVLNKEGSFNPTTGQSNIGCAEGVLM